MAVKIFSGILKTNLS